jgi:sulfatase modifying factor 1
MVTVSRRFRDLCRGAGAAFVYSVAGTVAHGSTITDPGVIIIDWVTVGNPGNTGRTQTYDQGGTLTFGTVDYEFRIAKHLVTIEQYTVFLNAVAKSDPYSLYDENMATNLNVAGISQSGDSGSFNYSFVGFSGNKPITYVSWFDAARFANWMHNGQGSGSTETGAYTLVDGQTSGVAPAKNPGARFSIPTEDEWYKAAYYSPVKGGAGSPGYYTYATQSDSAPGNVVGSGTNQANYFNGVFSVTQSANSNLFQNYLTDVGAFTNSASYYGTFDQSGNVGEWNDLTGAAGSLRGFRGGNWLLGASFLSSADRNEADASAAGSGAGFRLVSPVPEPATWGLASGAAACACAWRAVARRRRGSTRPHSSAT